MQNLVAVVLFAGACQAAPWVYPGSLGYIGVPVLRTAVHATGSPVPVAVGGYRAVAGEGGAVHEVPGLVPAPALLNQESAGGVSLSTGTGAVVHVVGKREAEADPSYLAYGLHGLPVVHYPLAYSVAVGGPVPVAVGGYKAVAGEGGAVHEVPGLVPAPALAKQEAAGGVSLTTGTGAYIVG